MDCEKFDQHVIDELYDELDELTHAALKRHVEGCSRCAGILSSLRATREVGVLPLSEPSAELEARILDAVTAAQRKTPWTRKVLRGLAWAGSHAMRPQLAMAALFFLVIGSSLLLLRAKPGTVVVPVRVTENGAPNPDQEPAATIAMAQPTSAPAAAIPAEPPADSPLAAAETKSRDEGAKDKDGVKAEKGDRGDKDAAKLALDDARSVRATSGCAAAVSKFDEVGTRFPGSGPAADAMWEAAACYKSMGELEKARQLYLALKGTGSYRARAEQELSPDNNNMMQNQLAARAAAPPPPAAAPAAATAAASVAAAPAAKAAAAESQATKPGKGTMGSSGKANAAPKRPASVDTAAGF